MPLNEALRRIRDGEAAEAIGRAAIAPQLADPNGPAGKAACSAGCAFCCILTGEDGGTITQIEARRLHEALMAFKGQPDGRQWTQKGCPSLDPETRLCRVYEARPMICRSYVSSDVSACETIAGGMPAEGTGVLGAQTLYLAVLTLSRNLLKGITRVPTFSLARVAAGAVDGDSLEDALSEAQHSPRELDDEIARQAVVLKR
ncbi:MAG: YkgJ family cysteine cluster protein [Boseongicola sp.]|nr:YkgJ family cysteine cluster protein [Boseongicola sp.]